MSYFLTVATVLILLWLVAESGRCIVVLARVALAAMDWLHDKALIVGAWWWGAWWWLKRRG